MAQQSQTETARDGSKREPETDSDTSWGTRVSLRERRPMCRRSRSRESVSRGATSHEGTRDLWEDEPQAPEATGIRDAAERELTRVPHCLRDCSATRAEGGVGRGRTWMRRGGTMRD